MRLPLPSSGAEPFTLWRLEGRGAGLLFWGLLVGLTALRLVLAGSLGVTPDEAYYWLWSRHLQPGYLDHPPMIAVWIRAGTAFFGDSGFGIRAPGALFAFLGSIALVQSGKDLFSSRAAGYRAALLLNATLMLGLGAATATPDTPLVFFLGLVLWAIGRLVATGRPVWWPVIGLVFGLAFDSKYTAVLPALGCGLWALSTKSVRRHWLWLAAGVLAGLVAIAPVLSWNWTHHWASFAKQGGRAADWHPLRALGFLGELAGGQIGLATPVIFILFCIGIAWCVRRARIDPVARLLACLCLVPLVVFVQHAFGGRVQANWPVVLYPAASLAAAAACRRIGVACATGLAMTLAVTFQGIFAPVPLSAHHDVIARQTADWSGLARGIRAALPPGDGLLVGDYALAAILAYEDPSHVVFSYDARWSYLGKAKMSPGPSALLLRDTETPDLPASWLASDRSQHLCRKVRGQDLVCYRLIPVELPDGITMYRLP